MAYVLTASFSVKWVGDGCGPMSVPGAQVLTAVLDNLTGLQVPIPGADAPSTANITTACGTMGTAAAAQLNKNITQIQGFATGGQ